MDPLEIDLDESRPLFLDQARAFVAACRGLSDLELLDPSRCRGWSRLEVVVHVRGGLDEMAACVSCAADGRPDADAASYWLHYPNEAGDPVPHIMWLRRTASAYSSPLRAVVHLGDTVERACAAVAAAPDRPVSFQGMIMSMGDFVATWVVELAVHQLDLGLDDAPVGLDLTRRTLGALAGTALSASLTGAEAVLAALGRVPWPAGIERPDGFPMPL